MKEEKEMENISEKDLETDVLSLACAGEQQNIFKPIRSTEAVSFE